MASRQLQELQEAMDDPSQYNILRVGQANLPIFIPWNRERRFITSGFDPTALNAPLGPWKRDSAFSSQAFSSPICETTMEVGAAFDVQDHGTSNGTVSEHMGGRLGVSAGNSLASAGVTVSYDEQVDETTNASRALHNSRLRRGRIALASDPPLSAAAKALLQEQKYGPEPFAAQYGHYFVAGYVLGADSGCSLTASCSTRRQVDTLTTTVNVQVLWEEYTDATSTTRVQEACSMDLAFRGYDTLEGVDVSLRAGAGEATGGIRDAAVACVGRVNSLAERLDGRLQELGIGGGEGQGQGQGQGMRSIGECVGAVDAGVVVELILVPFGTLREYVECVRKFRQPEPEVAKK